MRRYMTLSLPLVLFWAAAAIAAAPVQKVSDGKVGVGSLVATWETGADEQSVLDVDLLVPDGTTAGNDLYGLDVLIQTSDADADLTGIRIILDATAAAAAGSYEAGIKIDCEENTAGACTDGLLLTSSGLDAGMTDAVDASAAYITNALNVGANTITGTTAVIDFTNFDVSAAGLVTAVTGQLDTLNVGEDGTAGQINIWPTTADKGKFTLSCADQTGDTAVTLKPDAHGQATTVHIADGGAANAYVVQSTAAITLAEADVLDGVTAGSASASKVTVLDASKDLAGVRGFSSFGDLTVGETASDPLNTTGAADILLRPDITGGNAGLRNQIIGLPRIQLTGIGTMVNGSTNTVITDIGDSETPATDWTAIDADVVMSNDATYYRQGTASLKMAVAATAIAADGCTNTLASGNQDWTADEAVGMWVYSDTAFDADDLNFVITDSVAGDSTVQFPAVTADSWQWVELDISGVADASKDVVTDVSIELNAASALIGVVSNLYVDFIVKWDVADEDALPVAILTDGVLSLTMVDATTAGATSADLTLYTDYFVHYQSGADAIVMITDQSGADKVGLALIAY